MSFMLFIGPIIGVAVAIIAAVVIISVIAAAVSQKDINSKINKKALTSIFWLKPFLILSITEYLSCTL